MPWLTGHSLSAASLRHALGFPGLAGFKDSSGDLGYLASLLRLAAARPELAVLVGSDFDVLAALRLGAHGCVAGGSNLYPGRFRRLLDAHRAGDAGLAEPQGDRSPPAFAHAPVARVVLYTSVEVFHHGAEVCLLRDLYRASGGDAA